MRASSPRGARPEFATCRLPYQNGVERRNCDDKEQTRADEEAALLRCPPRPEPLKSIAACDLPSLPRTVVIPVPLIVRCVRHKNTSVCPPHAWPSDEAPYSFNLHVLREGRWTLDS